VFLAIKGRVRMAGGPTLRERARGHTRPHLPMRGANRLYGANDFSISTAMLVLYPAVTVTECDFSNAPS
jgi:hypothetical protein